jgi:transcriptional regulator with XRE-family HTH domain
MAHTRPALEKAVNEILKRHGTEGRRMSYRQAERRTGLSPATVAELAKGNARTPETVRRFAEGLGEDLEWLLLLAGFVPDEVLRENLESRDGSGRVRGQAQAEQEGETRAWLERFGRALAQLPPGRERDLWKENLRRDTELMEAFLELLARR